MSELMSDVRSNPKDQIAHAAEALQRSEHRRRVFCAVYKGKAPVKTVAKIAATTGLTEKQVLNAGKKLADNDIVRQTGGYGNTAYEKYPFYSANKTKVLRLAASPDKLASFPTKTNPRSTQTEVRITLPRKFVETQHITVDDLDSFERVRKVKSPKEVTREVRGMCERDVKLGIRRILQDRSTQKDWGGETSDIYTRDLRLKGRRIPAAFALKGRGTRGKLVPGKMGRNGDQIQRLFSNSAELFVVQYVGEIDESVLGQMEQLAGAKSATTGRRVYYGVIDGGDTQRLVDAYPKAFGKA